MNQYQTEYHAWELHQYHFSYLCLPIAIFSWMHSHLLKRWSLALHCSSFFALIFFLLSSSSFSLCCSSFDFRASCCCIRSSLQLENSTCMQLESHYLFHACNSLMNLLSRKVCKPLQYFQWRPFLVDLQLQWTLS